MNNIQCVTDWSVLIMIGSSKLICYGQYCAMRLMIISNCIKQLFIITFIGLLNDRNIFFKMLLKYSIISSKIQCVVDYSILIMIGSSK